MSRDAGRVGEDVPRGERREAGGVELGQPARRAGPSAGSGPSWASRMTAVATIGLVIDASRQTALVPIRGPSARRERVEADDALGAGDPEDHERDRAGLDLAGGEARSAGSKACAHRRNDTPAAGTARGRRASRRHAHDRPRRRPGSPRARRGRRPLVPAALLPPGAVPEALNPVLVTYETSGGECPEGPCGFTAEIHRDGRSTAATAWRRPSTPRRSRASSSRSERADWDAILAVPFEGECPRNFDGQEEIYTFHVGAGAGRGRVLHDARGSGAGAVPDGAGDPVRRRRLTLRGCAPAQNRLSRGDRFRCRAVRWPP